jgi:molybdopterin/thiamine biosynthesis adenylyltransferase/rhodanese-related sulfurtransferase
MPDRYLRQKAVPEIGIKGQEALRGASVLMVGCGGLASPVLAYLAGAGVGRIGLVDGDRVEITNLHRQILFRENQTGKSKVEAACESLTSLNPEVRLEPYPVYMSLQNAETLARSYDLLLDGTDQYEAKGLLNRVGLLLSKPVVFAGVTALDAQIFVGYGKKESPCYQCVYPHPPSSLIRNCEEAGVVGPMVGLAGSIQALQAIKILSGISVPGNNLLCIDGRTLEFRNARIQKNNECPACGANLTKEATADPFVVSLPEVVADPGRFVLFDVREESETREEQIPGARLLPFSVLTRDADPLKCLKIFDLPKSATPVFFCKSGIRAQKAVHLLNACQDHGVRYLPNPLHEVRSRL